MLYKISRYFTLLFIISCLTACTQLYRFAFDICLLTSIATQIDRSAQ